MPVKKTLKRCAWCLNGDAKYIAYHDEEWGVPVTDDVKLFEFIVLESAQAGLSWRTILNRREGYRKAFKSFNPVTISKMTEVDVLRLMKDDSIIRNRLKIAGTVANAKSFLVIQKEFGSFASYIWNFVHNRPIKNSHKNGAGIPATSELAIQISKDLKKRGFKFLGPTIVYAFMQAVGLVNDHTKDCFRFKEVQKFPIHL